MPLHNDIYTLTSQIIKQKNEGLLYENEEEFQQETRPMATTPLLTMIAAAAENNALGKNNDLIWHISEDLKRFKRLTSGHAIIMGRKTFESMTKALPNRKNIVLTNKKDYQPEGATVVHTLEDALALVKDDSQPFIIGGGEIYRLFMPYCDRIELTRVHHNFEADVFFPEIDLNHWKEIARVNIEATKEQPYHYSYITFEKK